MSKKNRRQCCLIGIVCCALSLSGCGYGEMSGKAYKHATVLYSICNQKDSKRLEKYAGLLEDAKAKGEITEKEAEWFSNVVSMARKGEWGDAAAEAREMLMDQVKDGP